MNFEPNETVLRRERLHPGIFAVPVLVTLFSLLPGAVMYLLIRQLQQLLGSPSAAFFGSALLLLPLLPGLVLLVAVWLAYLKSEIILTNRRLLFRTGFLVRSSGELPLENVEGIFIFEPLLGRLFGFGTVSVTSMGGGRFPLRYIAEPQVFHAGLQRAVASAKRPVGRQGGPPPPPDGDSRYMPKL